MLMTIYNRKAEFMKTYNFKINKSTKKNTTNVINDMNKSFLDAILDFAPYLKPEKKTNTIDVFLNKSKDLSDSFNFYKACEILSKYNSGKDEYDYELADGTPVRVFDDEIQVGYDVIPLNWFLTPDKYTSFFTPKKKKLIIDIAIKIAA